MSETKPSRDAINREILHRLERHPGAWSDMKKQRTYWGLFRGGKLVISFDDIGIFTKKWKANRQMEFSDDDKITIHKVRIVKVAKRRGERVR